MATPLVVSEVEDLQPASLELEDVLPVEPPIQPSDPGSAGRVLPAEERGGMKLPRAAGGHDVRVPYEGLVAVRGVAEREPILGRCLAQPRARDRSNAARGSEAVVKRAEGIEDVFLRSV